MTGDSLEWAKANPLPDPTEIPQAVLDRLEAASVLFEDDEEAADVLLEWAERYAAASTRQTPADTDDFIRAARAIKITLHIESMRRRGIVTVLWYGPDPYAEGAVTTAPREPNGS